ncbi:TetR/AcrR family transcriptional regulator [Bailinhaonella thermotolerans]
MPAKRPPVPLSRERILDAALRIADGQGLGRLTMRRLGDALEVEAMAIYHHFPNGKEQLFDALTEYVTAIDVETPTDAPWRERIAAWCRASRAQLLDHPGVLSLVTTRPPRGAARQALDRQLEILADAGLADPAQALYSLRSYLLGSVSVDLQDPERPRGDDAFERGLAAMLGGIAGGRG